MYTTSSVFLQTLSASGITHVFVNWGSDHPALLEDVARRIRGSDTKLKFFTCPNEMVALSAAQGFAQITGKPSAVIVHVDVGTQALAGAVHNADRGRAPVLIYAGASPFTLDGELRGSRNEWIMWMQDIPDQASIVRQYMRYTGQIHSGKNVSQVVKRALQIATSEPKGPVYLYGRREVMEEEVAETLMNVSDDIAKWPAIEPAGLSPPTIEKIRIALLACKSPLIITSRMPSKSARPLFALATSLSIPIFFACPSVSSLPLSHPNVIGLSYLNGHQNSSYLAEADLILVFDCDVPWITYDGGLGAGKDLKLADGAQVFIFDSGDPLRERMGMWHIPADLLCRVDSGVALEQISQAIASRQGLEEVIDQRSMKVRKLHDDWVAELLSVEGQFSTEGFTTANIAATLRSEIIGRGLWARTIFTNEGITNYDAVWAHLLATPDSLDLGPSRMLTSGGSSLGWALAASVGVHLGSACISPEKQLVVCIIGDGSYMFSVPSSAYWIARKYETPFLTIILNNGGWKAPKASMLAMHPSGHGAPLPAHELSTGFGPHLPDYAGIAIAATDGWAYGRKVRATEGKDGLKAAIQEGVRVVWEEGRCAVLDCQLISI